MNNQTPSLPPDDYEIYGICMRLNGLFNSAVTFLVVYLIFYHTPKTMKVYRWFLLNLALCCYLLDAFLTFIFLPLPIYPVLGGCVLGLMSPLGYMAPVVAWITFTQLLSFTAIAVFLALLFRLAAVYGRSELFERKSVICACVILEFCYGIPVLISGLCNYPTEQQSLAYMETNNLELLPFYHSHACAVMIVATEVLIRYLSAVVPSVALIVGLIIGVLVLLIKRLSAWKHNISAKTYRMHKSLTISLCFQFALPMLMIAISESCFVLSAIFQFRSAKITTMHTSANGIIMITFVKPYRDAFLAMIPMLKAVQQRRRKGLAITQEFATRSTVILPEATRAQPKTITMLRSMVGK